MLGTEQDRDCLGGVAELVAALELHLVLGVWLEVSEEVGELGGVPACPGD